MQQLILALIKKFANEDKEVIKISKDQIKNTAQTKPDLSFSDQEIPAKDVETKKVLSFEDLITLASTKKEIK